MFDPVRPDSIPPENTRGALDEIFGRRGLLGGLVGGSDVYKKQTIRTSGKTVVQINSRKLVSRHHLVTFNIGDLHKRYGADQRIFKKVAIDDPTYQQREVLVNLDGSIRDEFENMINSVSVTLRKPPSERRRDAARDVPQPGIAKRVYRQCQNDLPQ
jgi:hypothetical protein